MLGGEDETMDAVAYTDRDTLHAFPLVSTDHVSISGRCN